jgi:hypothetical protein
MTRFATKLALSGAVLALVSVPGIASAASTASTVAPVDEATGPASFANVAGIKVGPDQGAGFVIAETQRSPLSPGTSTLSQDRTAVPKDDGERAAIGANARYSLTVGRFGDPSPFPAEVKSADHQVVASLAATTVPSAVAESNYALLDSSRGKASPADNAIVVFEDARSSVECSAVDHTTSTDTAAKLWLRDAKTDQLVSLAVPSATQAATMTGVKAGPPADVEGALAEKTTSDVTVSRVTSFDQLLRQDAWRGGDVTAVSGWRIDVVTHVVTAAGPGEDVRTRIVLGGVSCSLPKGFVALPAGGATGGDPSTQPVVPTAIPAGTAAVARDTGSPWGFVLVGGGVVLAIAASVRWRRRPAVK